MRRQGYLSMPEYGYALALLARCRNEDNPPWAKLLRPDVRSAFKQACRFLAAPVSNRGFPATAPDLADEEDSEQPVEQELAYEDEESTRDDESLSEQDHESSFSDEEDDQEMRFEGRAKTAGLIGRIVSGLFATGFFALLGMIAGALMGEVFKSAFGWERAGDIGAILGAMAMGLYAVRMVLRQRDQ